MKAKRLWLRLKLDWCLGRIVAARRSGRDHVDLQHKAYGILCDIVALDMRRHG